MLELFVMPQVIQLRARLKSSQAKSSLEVSLSCIGDDSVTPLLQKYDIALFFDKELTVAADSAGGSNRQTVLLM